MPLIQQPVLDPRSAIAEANGRFMASLARQDAASIAALYTQQGQVLAPGGDAVRGRAAIEQFFRAAMEAGIRGIRLETVELDARESTAIEVGTFILAGEGGAEIDRGKYVVVWKQEGDEWKLHRDIWNSSLPPR